MMPSSPTEEPADGEQAGARPLTVLEALHSSGGAREGSGEHARRASPGTAREKRPLL
jgi:hypothetical protein